MEWWGINQARFPIVASLAREWLAVPATSTPSERVFSICGLVNQAKRTRMTPATMQSQVMMHMNAEVLETKS